MSASSSTFELREEREENEFERNIPPQDQYLPPIERGEKGGEDETIKLSK